MRDLQLEIPARFPTHYPFRARELLNPPVTLQLSAEISFEQGVFRPSKDTRNTKRNRLYCIAEDSPECFRPHNIEAKGNTFAFYFCVISRDSWAEQKSSDRLHRCFVYETYIIVSCLLKNSPNSSKKNELNPVLPIKKLDLQNCDR